MTSTLSKLILLLLTYLTLASAFTFGTPKQYTQDQYNVETSKQYALLSALAFCPKNCIEGWTCKGGLALKLTDLLYIEHPVTKAAGYIGYYPAKQIIVASFRGSDNIQNWIEDFNFQKSPYPFCLRCEIHAGFFADYLLIEPTVNQHVEKLLSKYPESRIVTTGHSLGAALSVISALQLKVFFSERNIEIHNFGQPRIGNVHLAKHINNKINTVYRVVHERDLVPHLPPDVYPFQYHHAAFEVFLNEECTEHKICNSSGEDRSCSNKFAPEYSTGDHEFYYILVDKVAC